MVKGSGIISETRQDRDYPGFGSNTTSDHPCHLFNSYVRVGRIRLKYPPDIFIQSNDANLRPHFVRMAKQEVHSLIRYMSFSHKGYPNALSKQEL